MKKTVRSTLRIEDRLDFQIKLLASRNNMSANKMINYLLELGISTYLERFDNYYQEQNKKLEQEEDYNDNED